MIIYQNITNNRFVETFGLKVFSGLRKILLRGMITTIGISSLMIGLEKASFAANSTVLSQSESGAIALSSESLGGIHQENLKDYSKIFSETNPLPPMKPIVLNQTTEKPVIYISPEILDLIKRIDVNTGGSSLDSEELVKVRYRVDLT